MFTIPDISLVGPQHLNDFFMNGFESNRLIEHDQKLDTPDLRLQTRDWYFDGIRMGFSDWQYDKPKDLKWSYDIKIELVTFVVCLKGVELHIDPVNPRPVLGSYQYNLFYSGPHTTDEGILRYNGNHASMFFMQFTKPFFLKLTQNGNAALNRFNEDVINGTESALSFDNLPVNAAISNILHNLVNCIYTGGLKKMFLLSKCIELLVLQAEACNVNLRHGNNFIKTDYDKECIEYAREYMLENVHDPPSLSELSKLVGINEYKLKKGFKETFGTTVFGYLSDTRLDFARNELLANRKTAGELALALGYSSIQHFSGAFKKKFGSSPNKMK
jgi:AraC-like DNA-binding protein